MLFTSAVSVGVGLIGCFTLNGCGSGDEEGAFDASEGNLSNALQADPLTKGYYWTGGLDGCLPHPVQHNHPLDKCSTDSDPMGCTGGADAADCFCQRQLGPTAKRRTHFTKGGVDHTWSCAKDHENFCLWSCECLTEVHCTVNNHDWVTADFCLEQIFGTTGGGSGYYEKTISTKEGNSFTKVHTEQTTISWGLKVQASAEDFMPGMAAKLGLDESTNVVNAVTDSTTNHHYQERDTTIKIHVDLSKPQYFYRGYTRLNLVTDGPMIFYGSESFSSNVPAKRLCMTLNYRRRSPKQYKTQAANAYFDDDDELDFADFFANDTIYEAAGSFEVVDNTSNEEEAVV